MEILIQCNPIHQPQEPAMPDIPAQKIISLIAELREAGHFQLTTDMVLAGQIADVLQKMVDDEVDALDAYYEKMAQEAFEMEDGRRVMEDAAIEKGLRYLWGGGGAEAPPGAIVLLS